MAAGRPARGDNVSGGEAKRRRSHVAAGGADWGLVGYRNPGRRGSRLLGRWITATGVAGRRGVVDEQTIFGTVKRTTPRRHELKKIRRILRREQSR